METNNKNRISILIGLVLAILYILNEIFSFLNSNTLSFNIFSIYRVIFCVFLVIGILKFLKKNNTEINLSEKEKYINNLKLKRDASKKKSLIEKINDFFV
jgi:amino acid permease